MKERLKEIFDYRDMVNSLVRRDLRGKIQRVCTGVFVDIYQSTVSDDCVHDCVFCYYTQ